MDLTWREHKRFVLGVAGAVLVGLGLYVWMISPDRQAAEKARAERVEIRKAIAVRLQEQGQPTEEVLGRAAEDLQRIEKDVRSLVKDLAFPVPARFRTPKEDRRSGAKFYFDTQLREVRNEFRRRAPKTGAEGLKLPQDESYGFPANLAEKDAPECLTRLAVLHRLVSTAMDAEAREIAAIQALPGGTARGEDLAPAAGTFLQRRPVEAQIKTDSRGLVRLLHDLSQKGGFLALEKLTLTKEDPHADAFAATIGVSALSVGEEGKLKGSTPGKREGAKQGPRGFFRRR